jgi:phosphoheptose isomerase
MADDPRFRNRLPQAESASDYLREYVGSLTQALEALPTERVEAAFAELRGAAERGARVFVAGNGGSAAIADHLCCDWMKGTHVDHLPALRVVSFTANTSLLTALANDFGYEASFARQVEMQGAEGDLLVLISSSGNSPNVLRAVEAARRKGMRVIGMTGFAGGKLAEAADVSLHVPVDNYGIAEDSHQMLMHVFAQLLGRLRDRTA